MSQTCVGSDGSNGVPVLIFGAGIAGEVLLRACIDSGISVNAFCDNNANKAGTLLCGLEVIHVAQLKDRYADAEFIIAAADIRDVVEQLGALGYSKWRSCVPLLKDFDVYSHQFSKPANFVEYAVGTAILCHESYMTPDKLFLRSVDIIITERCSNRCRDCANLMQYYERPRDCNTNELIANIDAFCTLVDEVNEFRVLGGEPFMNREAHVVIGRLIDEPKVKKVVIYTNGSIVPDETQLARMQSDKVLFIITNYGALSKKLPRLTNTLWDNRINFLVQKVGGWTDCAKIWKYHRSPVQAQELFGMCCSKNTFTMSDGKLFRCPFAANAFRLGAVLRAIDDRVDFMQGSVGLKNELREFILRTTPLATCDYCNGRPFGAPEIIPAIQADKPLQYFRY